MAGKNKKAKFQTSKLIHKLFHIVIISFRDEVGLEGTLLEGLVTGDARLDRVEIEVKFLEFALFA